MRIVSRILQTTDVMGLNCLGSVVRGLFATGVTIARRQSSGTWAVWTERLNIQASTEGMYELSALRTLVKHSEKYCLDKTLPILWKLISKFLPFDLMWTWNNENTR